MPAYPLIHRSIRSETSRRRSRMLSWALMGSIWFFLNYLLAHFAAWTGLFTYVFTRTVLIAFLAYLVAAYIIDKTLFIPPIEGNGIVFSATLLPFLLLPLGFAVLQIPYSRAGVVLAYCATSLWFWLGYRMHVDRYILRLGFLDTDTLERLSEVTSPDNLRSRLLRTELLLLDQPDKVAQCDGVVLDRYETHNEARTRLLITLKLDHVRIYSMEKASELLTGRIALSHIDSNFIDLDDHPGYALLKRLLDLAFVLASAWLVLPLCLLVALAIRCESKGPVLFSQIRVGLDGRPFRIWKFRSMRPQRDASPAVFAAEADPRITPLGRRLRKYRLDELPQLWNVLIGNMSLIGPRPEQVTLAAEFASSIPFYPYRHLVKPGLSGWAQVQQGYADNADATVTKLSYDLYYVKHASLVLDMLIFLKTIRTVLTGFGAR